MSKFTVTIEADSLPELADRVLALAAQLKAAPGDPVMPEVKAAAKKAPAKKEAPAAEGEQSASSAETVASSTTDNPASASPAATEEQAAPQKEPEVKAADAAAAEGLSIRDMTLKLVGMGRRDKVEAILAEFGLQKTTAVDDARKDEMVAALSDALAA